jgi:hypothetical protein
VSLLNLLPVFTIALAWFLYRLARSPRDPALWAVVACVAFHILASPTMTIEIRSWLGGMISPNVTKLVTNLFLNVSRYSLMLFFLISAGGPRRRMAWDGALLVTVCSAMAAAILATPSDTEGDVYPPGGTLPGDMTLAGTASFYLAGNMYTVYTAIQTGRWAWRYASESGQRARRGLRVAALGLSCYAVAATARSVVTIIRFSGRTGFGSSVLGWLDQLAPTGTLVFLVGVAYVGLSARLAALLVWARHRRTYHELRPLWAHLHAVFPDNELDRTHNRPWTEHLLLRRVHRRYLRRVVEIRDGLVELSPQLIEAGFNPDRPAHEQVAVFREALYRQAHGHQPESRSAILVAAPKTSDIRSDVEQLVALARALTQGGVS